MEIYKYKSLKAQLLNAEWFTKPVQVSLCVCGDRGTEVGR